MTDVLDELQKIKTQVSDVQRKRAKAEADLDAAKARLAEQVGVLREQYGCESLDEARARLTELETQLEGELQEIMRQLEEGK